MNRNRPSLDVRTPAADSGSRPDYGTPSVDTTLMRIEPALAIVALFTLGLRLVLKTEVTVGYVVALLLLPLWAPAIRRFRGARFLLGLMVLVVVSGVVLAGLSFPLHQISGKDRNGMVVILVGTLMGIGVLLWARTLMSTAKVTLWFALGMSAGAVLGLTAAADNPWKFVYAVPVGLLVLSLADLSGRRSLQIVGAILLVVVSVLNDSRSYLATFALVAGFVAWQLRPDSLSRRVSATWNAVLLVVVGWGAYYIGTTLLVDGYLGPDAQARSVAQIQTSGSLLLGGRPELAATWALMRDHPFGYGFGILPTSHDLLTAKTGMASIGYDPNNGYVERFMFGGHIELHSVFGDLWANCGIAGLALVVVTVVFTLRGLITGIAQRAIGAATVFACLWTLWNIPFSPLYAAVPTLMLALGLVLPVSNVANGSASPAPVRRATGQ